MRTALIISLSVHLLLSLLAFHWVSFRRVNYVPRSVYNVTLITPKVEAAPQEKQRPAPEKHAEIKPEPSPDVAIPTPQPTRRVHRKKKKPRPRNVVPTTEVDKTTPTQAAAEPAPPETGQVKLDADNFPFAYYIGRMRRKIAANWRVPEGSPAAERMCRVYFRVHRDGRVSDVAVEETSDLFLFDQSAERAVVQAAPFPPLPRAYADDYLGVHFTFAFRKSP